jgi:hypothetical protein
MRLIGLGTALSQYINDAPAHQAQYMERALVYFVLKPTFRNAFGPRAFPSLDPWNSRHGSSMLPAMDPIDGYDELRQWATPAESLADVEAYCRDVETFGEEVLYPMAISSPRERIANQSAWVEGADNVPSRRSTRIEAHHQAWWLDLYQKWTRYFDALQTALDTFQTEGDDAGLVWLADTYPEAFWQAVWTALLYWTDIDLWRQTNASTDLVEKLCALIDHAPRHREACCAALSPLLAQLHTEQTERLLDQPGVMAVLQAARIYLGPRRLTWGQSERGPLRLLRETR